jgi:hypothetical protein
MNKTNPCKHEKLEYLGSQPTLTKDETLFLFNCKNCDTTVGIIKKDILLILENTLKKLSK